MIKIFLEYGCGCRDTWLVSRNLEEVFLRNPAPCIPEHCQTCSKNGICKTRKSMAKTKEMPFKDIKSKRSSSSTLIVSKEL